MGKERLQLMPTKREIRLYGDLINQYKPTFKTMLKTLILEYFAKKMRYKHDVNRDGISVADIVKTNEPDPELFVRFAIVNNGTVEEIIIVNPDIAKLLKDKKTKIISFSNDDKVKKGMLYVDKKFVDNESGDNNEEN